MVQPSAILERVIDPKGAGFSPELARQVLEMGFSEWDHARYAELSAKAQTGALNSLEREELEQYIDINDMLTVLKSKAEASLSPQTPAA